ncbi:hypothetical protein BN8_02882 [Fibrisoma limi BUZ 3]|uniref:Uncharacterized protein n=1 Tax=Fibrisoma limi BUZ 3 TaxID=1185876 RepID=I2GIN6_9BACT|nr:hypothetical protein BN8_02882 [Fibrisoma limi BUZ 3]
MSKCDSIQVAPYSGNNAGRGGGSFDSRFSVDSFQSPVYSFRWPTFRSGLLIDYFSELPKPLTKNCKP